MRSKCLIEGSPLHSWVSTINQKWKCQPLFAIAVTSFLTTWNLDDFFCCRGVCTMYTYSSESNSAPIWWFINQLSVLKIKSTFIEKQTSIHIGAIICQSDRFYSNLSLIFFLKQMIYWSWQDLSSYQYQCDCQAVFVLPKVEWVGISVWIGKLVFQKVQQYSSFSWDRR